MTTPVIKVTAAKAVAAAIGTTLTAGTTALAAVQLAVEDGALSFDEISSTGLAIATAGATIYAVWKVRNTPTGDTTP